MNQLFIKKSSQILQAFNKTSTYRYFSSIKTHLPYPEFVEDHSQVDYSDLATRLSSKYLFNEDGNPLLFSSVQACSTLLIKDPLKSYYEYENNLKKSILKELGMEDEQSIPFVITNGCIANYRTVLDSLFLNGFARNVFIPRPSDNQLKECIFRSKLSYDEYHYLNYITGALNFGAMLEDFYLCSHHSTFYVDLNTQYPSGCTLRQNHWKELLACCKEREYLVWFNLINGNLGEVSFTESLLPVVDCISQGIDCILSIDFTNSLSLQQEGIGCVFAFPKKAEQSILMNGLDCSKRNLAICSTLLTDEALRKEWNDECTKQRERFASLRCRLVKSLTFNKRSFLQEQKGPSSVIPLSRRVLKEKKKELNFAWREDGVLNLSGITEEDIPIVVDLLDKTLCKHERIVQ